MKNTVYRSFLISYLLISLLPFIISLISYNETLRIAETDATQSTIASLEKCRDIIDRRIEEVDRLVTRVSLGAKESNISLERSPYEDTTNIIKILDFQKNLRPLLYTNNFVNDIYVFFNTPKIVVSPSTSFFTYEQFYGDYFQYSTMDLEEWKEKVLNSKNNKVLFPSVPVTVGGKTNRALIYIQSFPLDGIYKGNIIALIPETEIIAMMDSLYMNGRGNVFIVDKENNVLLSTAPDSQMSLHESIDDEMDRSGHVVRSLEGEKMLLSYAVSPYNGWKYIAAMPYTVITEKLVYVKKMILILVAVNAGVISMSAAIMAYQKSKPMQRMVSLIKEKLDIPFSGKREEIDWISQSLTKLISSNRIMEENLAKHTPILKNAFVGRLLRGIVEDMEEFRGLMSQLGIHELRGEMVVMVVKMNTNNISPSEKRGDSVGWAKSSLYNAFAQHFANNIYRYDMDYETIVFVIGTEGEGMADFELRLEEIARDARKTEYESVRIPLTFSAGGPVQDFMSIRKSFEEAVEMLDYKFLLKDKPILWYHDIMRNGQYYYYPLDAEIRLIGYVKEGNAKMISSVIGAIYTENFLKRNISAAMAKCLINEMKCTLLKVLESLKFEEYKTAQEAENTVLLIDSHHDVDKIFSRVIELYEEICNITRDYKNNNKTARAMEAIVKYIEMNYMDQQLNMAAVADQFNFSGSYLSRAFKEYTGETFSVYLERIRINKACDLLLSHDNIEDVAKTVGYNSIHAFRKAFKRTRGMTPSEYKLKSIVSSM